jgi:Fe-Mn family superoxide dismutase
LITQSFGSLESFKEEFLKTAAGQFWSGWTWLIQSYDELKIVTTPNQENPFMKGNHILLWVDVWEHAYYLKYQNRRAEYLVARWDVINWDVVSRRVR